jgi:signal transduction histidine kinase/CheY-like chemotaxis protein/HPt (histidine-containing phosphotransfer) domain-containing protein
LDLIPTRPASSTEPSFVAPSNDSLSLHDRRQQAWHVAVLVVLLAALTAPTWFLADAPYRGTLDLHAATKVLGAFVGLATGLTLVLRYFRLGRNPFYLFVGLAFLINGIADFAHGLLCFRGFLPLGERDRGMAEFLRTVYFRSQLLMGGAMLAALMAPIPSQQKGWRSVVGWTALILAVPLPFILLWYDLGLNPASQPLLGAAVFVVVLAAGLLCLDRYLFRHELFSWWLAASLFVNALGVLLVVLSREPLDPLFDLAHLYKAIGYFLPLVGCLLHQVARERAYFIAQDALIAAREAAMAGDRAKSQFLANMSHELRTPMNGVLGLVGRALRRGDSASGDLKAAYQSAQGLLQLLDDVLDLSRIDAGALTLSEGPFRTADLLEHAVQPLLPLIHQKKLVVLKEIDPSTPTVLVGDAARIRQILMNLAGNAAKFTDRGRITLRVRFAETNEHRGRLYFEVEDTGIGIPADKQAVVFEAFQQVDDTTTRRYGGAGLGLAICVELVRRLGGSISLKSEEGVGSTFSFDVGVRQADDGHDSSEVTTLSDHTLRFTSTPKVLAVAEDNPINRRVLVGMLEEIGHAPIAVEDGRSLINLLRSPDGEAIDGVLLDLQMPELSGVDVAKTIRAAEAASGGRRMPIIAVTAHAMKGDRERCLQAGMDDYLVKPVEPNKLFEVLESIPPRGPAIESAGFRRQIGGRMDLGRELTTIFATELPELSSAALEAIERRDSARLIDVAHRLAGSLANFHATTARDLARRLELAAREGNWDAAQRTLPVLRLWIDRSLAELDKLLAVEVGAA